MLPDQDVLGTRFDCGLQLPGCGYPGDVCLCSCFCTLYQDHLQRTAPARGMRIDRSVREATTLGSLERKKITWS